jgi:hypothetical protein
LTLRLNGSTSGYTELDAPAVAGSNSIVLPTGNGSAYQVLRNGATAGSLEFTDKIVSGTAVASTSGTSIDFTGIPSWVKRVTVMFNGVSTSGTSNTLLRLGAGSIASSGYSSANAYAGPGPTTSGATDTSGFLYGQNVAASTYSGNIVITNLSGNSWICSIMLGRINDGFAFMGGGNVTLSGTLDRVRITTVNGTDTFDAGSINILME